MPSYYNPSSRPETIAENARIEAARATFENLHIPHPGDSQKVYTDTEGNFRPTDPNINPSSFRGAENDSSYYTKTIQQEVAAYRNAILNANRLGQISDGQMSQLFRTPYQDGREILKEFLKNGPSEATNIPNGRVETGGGGTPRPPNNPGGAPTPDTVVGEGSIPRVPPEVAVGTGVASVASTVAAEAGAIPTIGSLLGGAAAAIAAAPVTPGLVAVIAAIGGLAALDWYLKGLQTQKIANQVVPETKAGTAYWVVTHTKNEKLVRNFNDDLNYYLQYKTLGLVGGGNSEEGVHYGPISDIRYFEPKNGFPDPESYPFEYSITCACTDSQGKRVREYLYYSHYNPGVIDYIFALPKSKDDLTSPPTKIQPDKNGQIPASNTTNITNNIYQAPPATLPGLPNTTYQPPQPLPQHQDQQAKVVPTSVAIGKAPQVTVSTPNNNPAIIYLPSNTPSQVKVSPPDPITKQRKVEVTNPNTLIPTTIETGPDEPVTIKSPSTNPITFNPPNPTLDPNTVGPNKTIEPTVYPGKIQEPTIYTGDPNNPVIQPTQKQVEGATPSLFQPNTYTPTKTTPVTPNPNIPTTPEKKSDKKQDVPVLPDMPNPLDPSQLIPHLIEIGTILRTIQNNTTPESVATSAATGTCRTTQPGGCMSNLVNQAGNDTADKINKNNNSLFDNLKNWFNTAILAPIMALLNRVGSVVGLGVFPATVPATFIASEAAVAETTVANIPELMAWQAGRLDELTGQFPIPIEIPGGKNLAIPNMAEGIAELIGMGLANAANSEMLLNLGTKGLTETGQTKQQGFKTYMAVEAIIEYLAFKHKEVQHQMPLSFKPGETDLLSLIKDNMQTVSVIEFDDKLTQRTILLDLAQAAAITRSRGFQPTKGSSEAEIRDELIARIKHLNQFSEGLLTERKDAQGLDSIDRMIQQIMHGYPDGQNPFACDGEQPPQITREKK